MSNSGYVRPKHMPFDLFVEAVLTGRPFWDVWFFLEYRDNDTKAVLADMRRARDYYTANVP